MSDVAALVEALTLSGHLTDEQWQHAAYEVPRELFIPARAVASPLGAGGGYARHLIDRDADPVTWQGAVYSDTPIVIQLDDGETALAAVEGHYTSSASGPSMVFGFLELLDPYAGDEVLEIGTGTGWTAALLSARLGAKNVTSIEVDEQVAKQAAANLELAGYAPNLVVGDGAKGWAQSAPFDRVHVTCGVREIPYAWVEQTRPGGIIALPWMPGFGSGHQVRLAVVGECAVGRFHGGCNYMMLRAQRPAQPAQTGGRESGTWVDPRRVMRSPYGAEVAIAGIVPGMSSTTRNNDDGTFDLWLWDQASVAHVRYSPNHKQSAVVQSGPRDLWDEVTDAFRAWMAWGEPGRGRFGLTVTPEGQHVWLDDPGHVVSRG